MSHHMEGPAKVKWDVLYVDGMPVVEIFSDLFIVKMVDLVEDR